MTNHFSLSAAIEKFALAFATRGLSPPEIKIRRREWTAIIDEHKNEGRALKFVNNTMICRGVKIVLNDSLTEEREMYVRSLMNDMEKIRLLDQDRKDRQ